MKDEDIIANKVRTKLPEKFSVKYRESDSMMEVKSERSWNLFRLRWSDWVGAATHDELADHVVNSILDSQEGTR